MSQRNTFTSKVKEALSEVKGEKKCCRAQLKKAEEFLENDTLVDKNSFVCPECRGAFLRGIFLKCGSVNAPDKSNHLELKMQNEMDADELAIFIRECGFEPKISKRKSGYIVYFKDGEAIFEFLSFIGAKRDAFDFLNTIIEKQIRNNCNRVTNCEYANMQKAANASARHMEAIETLRARNKLETLPEKLFYTATLKVENPDATLSELAALHEPPITKSCVNHRLEKLVSLSEK